MMVDTLEKLDMKKAYEILNLKEGCSKSAISQRYYILFKKFKASSAEEIDGNTLDRVTQAYNLLMGYEVTIPEAEVEAEKKKSSGWVYRTLGIDRGRLFNFIHYSKFHIIIGLIIVVFMAFTIRGCIMRVPPDFKMAFIGSYYLSDTDEFKKEIKERYPGIKEISIDMITISETLDPQQLVMMKMKALAIFTAEDIDIFIVDKATFNEYGSQGLFKPMDDIMRSAVIPLDDERALTASWAITPDQNPEPSSVSAKNEIYGFNLTGNPIFRDTEVYGEEYIFTVGIRSKFRERVVFMLNLLARKD